jgi:hypothetical protein
MLQHDHLILPTTRSGAIRRPATGHHLTGA